MRVEANSLAMMLRPLRPFLDCDGITELCINRPGEIFLESGDGWRREAAAFADFDWCSRLAKLIANSTQQRIDESSPLMSASLPGGERVQVVIPPATMPRCVAMTIRRPSKAAWSVDEMASRGIFDHTVSSAESVDVTESCLSRLLREGDHSGFMKLAVRSRKNILVSGPTGSGKTTWTKALIREIPPHERLITIEDAAELLLYHHPNHVRLLYSKGDQGLARVTPKQLLESCLRMKPDRILLAELRADEAFDYLRNVGSGHPGSITSIHASSAELAFEQLVLLIKQNPGGRDLSRQEIKNLLYMLVDVVIQFCVRDRRKFVQEIWYEPARKRRAMSGIGVES